MAKVMLTNVTADRVFWDGKGLSVVESKIIRGQEAKTYYSLFFTEPHNIQPGTVLSVEGELGAKAEQYTDKMGNPRTTVKLTVNFPKISNVRAGAAEYLAQSGAVELENAPF